MDGGRVGLQQASGGGGGWVVVEARLQGGAPWGFTLQGGLEHGEPLIISKVEHGGKADSLKCPLQVGDEIIMINDIELTGFRHEAIALVKGSYKTLHITVRRDCMEECGSSPPSHPSSYRAPSPPSPPPHPKQQTQMDYSRPGSTGGVQLRIRNRHNEAASRPHSWHSTKLDVGQQDSGHEATDTLSSAWPHNYHSSASTTDLAGDFDSDGGCLRKSPDQYSSRGSMESLDPPQPAHLQHHHTLGYPPHSGPHPAYSSCQQLSSARSSNSIDHLHSKRDSAYSSFSTSSSIPEYLASAPTFSAERSYSLETVPQKGGSGEMQHADIHCIRPVYNAQQELAQEQKLSSTSTSSLRNSDSRIAGIEKGGQSRDLQGGGLCYRGSTSGRLSGAPAANRHSVGPVWPPGTSHSSYENLRGVPAPPRRSDSYVAIKNHDRPNSWSSVEHSRSANRSLQKSPWHHSSGPVAAKGLYMTEDRELHTVIEKSPESSPTTKPRQGFPPPGAPSGPPTGPLSTDPQSSGRLVVPAGVSLVPQVESHYAQIPSSSPTSPTSGVYSALAKDSNRKEGLHNVRGQEEEATENWSNQQEDNHFGHNSPRHAAGRSESHLGSSPSHSPHRLLGHSNQGPLNQMSQPQDFFSSQTQSPPALGAQTCQEWRDPYTPVQSRSHTSRTTDQCEVHQEPLTNTRVAQGQVPPSPSLLHPQHQHPSSSQTPSRHYSDSAVIHYQHRDQSEQQRDKEHPLTRLENALVEVQQSTGPSCVVSAGSYDNSTLGDGIQGPTRSLSVLERVSRFEHRERAGRQRSYSITHSHNKTSHWITDKAHIAHCGAEDLRSMLERSSKGSKSHRTMSYGGGSVNYKKDRATADPTAALERSLSSLHLNESRGEISLIQDTQNMLGSYWDASLQRSYRDSMKDAQSKVLRSTSLRHNFSPNRLSEKKGPKTMPKPDIVVSPSPHTPKERHVVGPETRGPSPPALPSVPPVGPPAAVLQSCRRRRLTADQKKRSKSENNMNEVGIFDSETSSFFKLGGEMSVADRRKMFELGFSSNAISRPDLRQLQHDALAQYVQRKRSAKTDEARQRVGPRPLNAYLQLDNAYLSDTISLSSTSSLLSLQDPNPSQSIFSSERPHISSSPSADMRNLPPNFHHPGRATTPRPPSHPFPSGDSPPEHHTSITHLPHNFISGADTGRHGPFAGENSPQQKAEPQQDSGGPKQQSSTLRSSRKSASVEDLLERSEEKHPHASRSLSSTTVEMLKQDIPSENLKMFDAAIAEPVHGTKTEDRVADYELQKGLSSPPPSQNGAAGSFPDATSSHTPVSMRHRRQRYTDRQRAHSTPSLAASVGLPCPLTCPDRGGAEWPANQGLIQGHRDAATYPDIPQSSIPDDAMIDKHIGHSLSDGTMKDAQSEITFSLDGRGECHQEDDKQVPSVASSSLLLFPFDPTTERKQSENMESPSSQLSIHQHVSCQQPTLFLCNEDLDDVFLQNPAPPSLPPSIRETDIMEDFPPPTPDPILQLNNISLQTAESLLPSLKVQSSTLTSTTTSSISSLDMDSFDLEYEPLLKREKTPEEHHVEALSRQLVLQDGSLSSIFERREGKSTVELVEVIFQNSGPGANMLWQASNNNDRMEDGFTTEMDQSTGMDEDGNDLNNKKVELCEALRCSVLTLRRDKEALCEEQRRHQALGASLDSLVQKLCKINERDKYSMFIGDLEKIMNLLLSLCSRLARIDKSLLALEELKQEDSSEQRDSLHHKRSQLLRQTEDAWELKENLDRRQRVVHAILLGYLTQPQLQDYRHFVSTKPSLLIRQRNLDDLISQREEQLTKLAETLPRELAATWDQGRSEGSSCLSLNPAPFPQLTSDPSHSVRPTTVTSL
ncbi:protein Shroom3 isoform X1 [Entelurus aequoreus]|uniref:protein Shroom3 isoform X1 n=1 Tax=Entelurus aequoreus TaxID=161455 RepID=UPI002B1DEAFA|nr:protein Shroom3 isoform X1 [Entelurus aequoreus]